MSSGRSGQPPDATRRKDSIFFKDGYWQWFWQLLIYLPLLGAALIGVQIAIAVPAQSLGLLSTPGQQEEVSRSVESLVAIVLSICTVAAVLGVTWLTQRWLRHAPPTALGIGLRSGWLGDLSLGLGLGALFGIVSTSLMWLLGWYRPVGLFWQLSSPSEVAVVVLGSVVVVVRAAVAEEVAFRGYILQVLEGRWGKAVAVGGSSVLFGLTHLANTGEGYRTLVGVAFLALAGAVLAQAYLVSGGLWLPIGLHLAFNWVGPVGLGGAGLGPERAVLLVTEVDSPFSYMGSPVNLLGLALVSLLLWSIGRRRSRNPTFQPAN